MLNTGVIMEALDLIVFGFVVYFALVVLPNVWGKFSTNQNR